jgi:hypothetical protein
MVTKRARARARAARWLAMATKRARAMAARGMATATWVAGNKREGDDGGNGSWFTWRNVVKEAHTGLSWRNQ